VAARNSLRPSAGLGPPRGWARACYLDNREYMTRVLALASTRALMHVREPHGGTRGGGYGPWRTQGLAQPSASRRELQSWFADIYGSGVILHI